MTGSRQRSIPAMGTIVTIEIVNGASPSDDSAIDDGFARAFEWFREVERLCNRFDEHSELRRLGEHIGQTVPVSETLYAAIAFAIAVAEETDGAFDPTVGLEMEARGFNRDYRDGQIVRTGIQPDGPVSYRDVHMNREARTITLSQPLVLDLGAVAKGLAIDLAARELAPHRHFAIDAGGDLFVAGHNAKGEPWSIGIRHPRRDREVIELLRISDMAICTSGDYERRGTTDNADRPGHHILDARSGQAADAVASATVIAPTAMLADALATAAFVLGPVEGLRLLERHKVNGFLLSPTLERFATRGMSTAILPHA